MIMKVNGSLERTGLASGTYSESFWAFVLRLQRALSGSSPPYEQSMDKKWDGDFTEWDGSSFEKQEEGAPPDCTKMIAPSRQPSLGLQLGTSPCTAEPHLSLPAVSTFSNSHRQRSFSKPASSSASFPSWTAKKISEGKASVKDVQGTPPTHFWRPIIAKLLCVFIMLVALLLIVVFMAPFWAPAFPIPVDGSTDTFTILILSYGPRLPLLRGTIKHYSSCPSASSVVVVWNAGPPPPKEALTKSTNIPVRLRVETTNSLNNRFKPDPEIPNRAVFSVDDDIRIPCRDIEAGFATWRRNPFSLVGYFPRLIQGTPYPVFRGESYVVETGKYNAILTGAAFIDASLMFPAYWSDSMTAARAVVDREFNGEDLLMNFVVANRTLHYDSHTGKALTSDVSHNESDDSSLGVVDAASSLTSSSPVHFQRPKRRVDLSKLSPVGISHDMEHFQETADRYLREFVDVFGTNPLQIQDFRAAVGLRGPPHFCGTSMGCFYM